MALIVVLHTNLKLFPIFLCNLTDIKCFILASPTTTGVRWARELCLQPMFTINKEQGEALKAPIT
jgi:hypothetical protein